MVAMVIVHWQYICQSCGTLRMFVPFPCSSFVGFLFFFPLLFCFIFFLLFALSFSFSSICFDFKLSLFPSSIRLPLGIRREVGAHGTKMNFVITINYCLGYTVIYMVQICSGITSGRVLNGELYAQKLQKLICRHLLTGCFMKISL